MTRKTISAILLAMLIALSGMTAVFGETTESTPAPEAAAEVTETTEAPAAEATEAPAETTETAAAETTEAPAATEEPAETRTPVEELADDTVLATLNGEEMTYGMVKNMYNYYAQMYSAYGMDMTVVDNQYALLQSVMNAQMQQMLLLQKGAELGYDQFTDEEIATFTQTAQTNYDSTYASLKEQLATDGATDEETDQKVLDYMAQYNYNVDRLLKNLRENEICQRVYDSIVADVAVTDESVQTSFDEKVAAAKESYDADPTAFDTALLSGDTIYYVPAGYRAIKHILVKFDGAADVQTLRETLATEAADDAAREANQKKLDDLMAEIQPKLDEIQQKIDAGEDFQALIDEYGEDAGMKEGSAFAQSGYYIADTTTKYDPNFKDAAMALEKIGDVSAPVLSSYGFHFIQYASDVPSGAKTLEDVHDALSKELLDAAKSEKYSAQLSEWTQASEIVNNIA